MIQPFGSAMRPYVAGMVQGGMRDIHRLAENATNPHRPIHRQAQVRWRGSERS
jgi:hypothetical protein